MGIKKIVEELKKLSPEDKAALRDFLGGGKTDAAPAKEPPRVKRGPEMPKAGRVYFFRQLFHYQTEEMKREGDSMRKTVTQLPPRTIAIDEKMAAKLYWKQRGKYQYLGRSEGTVWRKARYDGKSVGEAQAMEFEAQQKNPDMTPPPNREKTFFAGTKPGVIARGQEISWAEGLKQNRTDQ